MPAETLFVPFIQTEVSWATEHKWKQTDAVDKRKSPSHALWLILEGTLHVACLNQERVLIAGDACFIPSGLERTLSSGETGVNWLSVGLQTDLFGRDNLFQKVLAPVVWQPTLAERATMADWMRRICDEREPVPVPFLSDEVGPQFYSAGAPTQPRGSASALIGDGLGRALLGLCWNALSGEKRLRELQQITPQWLSRTLAHLESKPETSVHELAELACLSPSQFRRTFHQWVGTSPQKYVMRCRLEEGRRLLATTDLIVNEIAERVGFQSLSYFTSLFRDHFGVTPARYRYRLQQPSEDTTRYQE